MVASDDVELSTRDAAILSEMQDLMARALKHPKGCVVLMADLDGSGEGVFIAGGDQAVVSALLSASVEVAEELYRRPKGVALQ